VQTNLNSCVAVSMAHLEILFGIIYLGLLYAKKITVNLLVFRGPSVILKFSEGRPDCAGAHEWRWS